LAALAKVDSEKVKIAMRLRRDTAQGYTYGAFGAVLRKDG